MDELSPTEGRAIFARACETAGTTPEAFLARYQAGEWADPEEAGLVILLPFWGEGL